jgi:hypothetical protein
MSQKTEPPRSAVGLKWLSIPVILIVYVIALYLIKPLAEQGQSSYIISIHNIAFLGLGAILFMIVARGFGWLSAKPGQTSMIISLGLILWTLAELIGFILESVSLRPFPYADVFYITGYFAFAIALILNIRTIHVKFGRPTLVAWIALSILGLIGVTLIEVVPLLGFELDPETMVSLVYPYEDLVILVLALVILLKFRSGEIAKPWGLLILGFILQAFGDIWYTYATNTGEYFAPGVYYHPSDLVLTLGYLVIFASGLLFALTYRGYGGRKSA